MLLARAVVPPLPILYVEQSSLMPAFVPPASANQLAASMKPTSRGCDSPKPPRQRAYDGLVLGWKVGELIQAILHRERVLLGIDLTPGERIGSWGRGR